MRVSIIIQNRNYGTFLDRCIRSALELDFPEDDFEVIGLDADSTDDSVEIYKKHPRVRLLEVGLVNQAAALNKALEIAKGDFIAWINADDYYLPNFIRSHLKAFEENPDAVLSYSPAVMDAEEIEDGRIEHKGRMPCYTRELPKRELLSWNFIMQPATMMRRSALDAVGGFDESFECAFDYKLWCDLALQGVFAFVPEETAVYSVRPLSMSNSRKGVENADARKIREMFRGRIG